MATNFEPHECVIFVQSTKIGTHENKAIHSIESKIYRYHLTMYKARFSFFTIVEEIMNFLKKTW